MKIQVLNDADELVWERSPNAGMTSSSYLHDGTQQQIINALSEALEQAEGQQNG